MATETSEQIVREAPEIEAYKLGLLKSAKALADKGVNLPAYQIAGMSQAQIDAITAGKQGIGAFQPYLNAAGQSMGTGIAATQQAMQGLNAAGQPLTSEFANARDISQQGIGKLQGLSQAYDPATQVQKFMNPYQQQVIDATMRQIEKQGNIAQQNVQAQAVKSGAFGGYRQGVQQAALDAAMLDQKNSMIANLMSQGYDKASAQSMASFEQQKARQLQEAGALQQAGGQQAALTGQEAGLKAQLAQGIGSLGGQMANIGGQQAALGGMQQQLGQGDVNFGYNLGSIEQQQAQRELDALRSTKLQDIYAPYQTLGFVSDIYKGAPSTQMAVTSAQQAAPSPFQQAAGLATGLLSTAGAVKAATGQGIGSLF